jgi:hypothetical protein
MNRIELQQRRRLLRLEAGMRERVEREALASSLGQTAKLAALRGEAVEQADGRLRIWSRDGLRSLYEADDLDASEYEAGLFFRSCFERVGALAASAAEPRVDASHGGLAEWRAWRAKMLGDMQALARSTRQATTLHRVAGEGRALRSLCKGGVDYGLNLKALRQVLGAIADRVGL